MRFRAAFLILLMGLAEPTLSSAAPSRDPAVPAKMQGVWGRDGRCDVLSERFTVTAHDAAWGHDPPAHIIYDAEQGAIEWVEEGVVDNFVLNPRGDILVHNVQGFGMPKREGLARCGRGTARVSWPPKPPHR